MHILITGAAGFLGKRLADALLADDRVSQLTLVDVRLLEHDDARATCLALDLTDADAVKTHVPAGLNAVYHLAAVVSAAAEADFDLGMRVNVDGSKHLLEHLRHTSPGCRVVFTSSLAIYGGDLPDVITDSTAFTPRSSYGTQKAIAELLLNDYSRKGFIDGITLRLPTVSVRPGTPNQAASSFASDIIREPLLGRPARCPVDASLELWLTSPSAAVRSLHHALTVDVSGLAYRSVNVSGITINVQEMLTTLEHVAGSEATSRVHFERVEHLETIITSWPSRFDTHTAEALGFPESDSFETAVRTFMAENVP